jgi:murein peptide amidase A
VSETRKTITEEVPALRQLQRLGKNINGYFGETINISSVLTDSALAAREAGWTIEEIPARPDLELLAFSRGVPSAIRSHPRVYLSAGIHGDEPATPLAMRRLLRENAWPSDLDLVVLPCLNPVGFILNRRENPEGFDLNRQYLQPEALEAKAHIEWLQNQTPFDLCICLHEDWESHGFYVYELNPDNRPSLAEKIVEGVREVCPIDHSEVIEGRAALNGIIRPSADPTSRPQWPESFYLLTHKTRLSYTLEAPSDFSLDMRVTALVVAVKAALQEFAGQQ